MVLCERSLASCECNLALCHLVSHSCTLWELPGTLSALFGILWALPCSLSPCEQSLHIVSAPRYLVSALLHLVSAALLSVTLWAILAHCVRSPVPCQLSLASCERYFALCHFVSNSCTLWALPGPLSVLFSILWALPCSLSTYEQFLHIVSAAWYYVKALCECSPAFKLSLAPCEHFMAHCERFWAFEPPWDLLSIHWPFVSVASIPPTNFVKFTIFFTISQSAEMITSVHPLVTCTAYTVTCSMYPVLVSKTCFYCDSLGFGVWLLEVPVLGRVHGAGGLQTCPPSLASHAKPAR